jgi:hypothetical protein
MNGVALVKTLCLAIKIGIAVVIPLTLVLIGIFGTEFVKKFNIKEF